MSDQPRVRFKRFWHLFAASLVISAGLQLASLTKWSVWHDEGYTAMLVDYPLAEMVQRTALDVHPPLYYVLLKGWLAVMGDSVLTARLFSVICMLAAAGVTVLFIRRFYSERYAAWAAIPIALGPMLIRYGQEMRMYGLVALLAITATWVFMSLLERRGDKSYFRSARGRLLTLSYGLLIASLLYSHYFAGGLLLPLHFLVLLSDWFSHSSSRYRIGRFLKTYQWWFLGALLGVVLFLPWLPTFADQVKSVKDGFWIQDVDVSSLFSTIAAMLFFRPEWIEWQLGDWYGVMALLGMGIVVWFMVRLWQQKDMRAPHKLLLGGYLAVPMLIMLLLSLPRPIQETTSFYYDRYFATFAPMFYAFIGVGLAGIWANQKRALLMKGLTTGCLGLFTVFGIYHTQAVGNNFGHPRDDYFSMHTLYEKLDALRRPGELVVGDNLGVYFDLRYYMTRDGHPEPLLFAADPLWKYGNTSLVYDRSDLLVGDFDALQVDKFWLVGPAALDMDTAVGPNWRPTGITIREGYAKFSLYIRQ
jgi:mannosyltransferase